MPWAKADAAIDWRLSGLPLLRAHDMKEYEIGRIQSVEPPEERGRFLKLVHELVQTGARLGGGDLWHVMAALELQRKQGTAAFLAFDEELIKAAPALGVLSVVDGRNLDCETLGEALQTAGRLPV